MVWIDVDIGGEAVDGTKMEDPSPFLMGEASLSVKFYSVGEFFQKQ